MRPASPVLAAALVAALFVGSALGMPMEPEHPPAPTGPLRLGMDVPSLAYLAERDAPAAYGAIWVGAWLQSGGWDDVDALLDEAARHGATPILHFWYWGDSIGPGCVEDGCWDALHGQWLSLDGWRALTSELARRIDGRGAIVVLESEFNKNGIDAPGFAPTFGALLREQTRTLQAANASVAIGFGAWAQDAWPRFGEAVAAADMVSLQAMRGSTRHTPEEYAGVAADTVANAERIATLFGKPVLLSDVAFSSYGDGFEARQADALRALLGEAGRLQQAGVQGLVYRAVRDDPGMSPENHFGLAEQRWGFVRADGSTKPALDVWTTAAQRR